MAKKTTLQQRQYEKKAELTEAQKRELSEAVKKTVKEYKKTLDLLAKT